MLTEVWPLFPGLLLAIGLACVPIGWVWRRRGPRRDRSTEGRADGLLLLVALVASPLAIASAGVAGARAWREARIAATWVPVTVTIERCSIATSPGGTRGGGRTHRLACEVRVPVGARRTTATVEAGAPSSPAGFEAFRTQHPPGGSLALRHAPGQPTVLRGLDDYGRATSTARNATRLALRLGSLSFVCWLVARTLVRRRTSG